jgi:hypothetical protein
MSPLFSGTNKPSKKPEDITLYLLKVLLIALLLYNRMNITLALNSEGPRFNLGPETGYPD